MKDDLLSFLKQKDAATISRCVQLMFGFFKAHRHVVKKLYSDFETAWAETQAAHATRSSKRATKLHQGLRNIEQNC